jgi:hypothetical protein
LWRLCHLLGENGGDDGARTRDLKITESEVRAMLKMFLHVKRWSLIAAVCISACAITGCFESSFDLASESRLPQGMAIPPGLTRADVSVTVDCPLLPKAIFTLRDKSGKKLATVTGKIKSNVLYLKSTPQRPEPRYPNYTLVAINGVIEIMEQRRLEPILYITDDPAIREELLTGRRVQ